jgi:hypothetical protein
MGPMLKTGLAAKELQCSTNINVLEKEIMARMHKIKGKATVLTI